MTISTEPAQLSYNGDDSTVDFAITWKYFAKSHVVAKLRDADGVETAQVLDTDFTLTDADVDAGGTLTMTVAPATGETLVIDLEPPNTQTTAFPLGGAFPSESVEDALDLAAQRDAFRKSVIDRTFRVPATDTASGDDLELPTDTARASKFFSFDANGLPTVAVGTSGDLTPVSAFMDTLLGAADAASARSTLVAAGTGVANTFTGANIFDANQTVGTDTTARDLRINGPAGDEREAVWQTAGLTRFTDFLTNLAESGANAGSNKASDRYDDAGAFLATWLHVRRSDGAVQAGASPTGGFAGEDIWNFAQHPQVNGTQLAPTIKRKTADESVASSIVLQNDDDLIFAIGASEEWIVEYYLSFGDLLSSTGIQVAVTVPTGATLRFDVSAIGNTTGESRSSASNASGTAASFTIAQFTSSTTAYVTGHLRVLNSTTAGNVTLQWTQQTSSATALLLRAGSNLIAHRFA